MLIAVTEGACVYIRLKAVSNNIICNARMIDTAVPCPALHGMLCSFSFCSARLALHHGGTRNRGWLRGAGISMYIDQAQGRQV